MAKPLSACPAKIYFRRTALTGGRLQMLKSVLKTNPVLRTENAFCRISGGCGEAELLKKMYFFHSIVFKFFKLIFCLIF